MTPFAMLDDRTKSASVVVSGCGQVGRLLQGREAVDALLRMPGFRPARIVKSASAFPFAEQYLPGRVPLPAAPTQPAQTADTGWTWGDTGGMALDLAAGSNPFTGVPYYGAKAISDFSKGNIWSGIGNVGWGALSFLPGATSLGKGVVGGISRFANRVTPGFIRTMQTGSKLTPGMAKAVGAGGLVTGFGGMTGGMMTGEGAPEPQAAEPATQSNDFITEATNRIQGQRLSATPSPRPFFDWDKLGGPSPLSR